ncbi:hypothetical protein ANN_20567 [Periplaneta americana]|uniref:Uncharacterized protein n=1 Tax=Periplaneta americana TaxID=6978 RepID=A0ABQ8SD91_PERAM|nr:hypothetical protein ANN_20567 [Periplaneta americana]
MSPGSNTESYPEFGRIGLRENPGINLNQITCEPGPLGFAARRADRYSTDGPFRRYLSSSSVSLEPLLILALRCAVVDGRGGGVLFLCNSGDSYNNHKFVYEEVHGTADNGSNRRIDIIAISESLSRGMIIDPTIRFEKYKAQPEDVHEAKRAIYVPTIPYYKDYYTLTTSYYF